jgi:hypothetical protein
MVIPLTRQIPHDMQHLLAQLGIECRCRLVEKITLGFMANALAIATRC